jgi:hypothetical protein
MIHVKFSSFPTHFASHSVFMACLHNTFENDIIRYILCFVKIHYDGACGHAHLQFSKLVHNVWFQQSGKRGACLYIVTSNDYVWAFKQTTLYYHFKKGGPWSQGLIRSELLFHKAT